MADVVLPVAHGELTRMARRGRTYLNRCTWAAVASVLIVGFLSPSFRGVLPATVTGHTLFLVMATGCFLYALIAGSYTTSDAISLERREGTLGLLLLTRLSGFEIVLGKLIACALNATYGMVAVLPLLSLPMMIGGVTSGEFWRVVLVLLITIFLSLSLALCVSTFSMNGRRALVVSLLIIAAWTVLPLRSALSGLRPVLPPEGWISPFFALVASYDSHYATLGSLYWRSIFVNSFAGGLCFVAAAFFVVRLPLARPERSALRKVALRSKPFSTNQRNHWLTKNPMLWVAMREGHRRISFWAVLAVALCVWIGGAGYFGGAWLRPEVLIAVATLVHLQIRVWLSMEVSRRLHEDKRAGVLELLLVTPLSVAQMLQGCFAALRQQFLIPFAVILGIDCVLIVLGMNPARTPISPALLTAILLAQTGMFLVDSYAIAWFGSWKAISSKTMTRAFVQTCFNVMVVPALIFAVIAGIIGTVVGGASALVLITLWFVIGFVVDAILTGWAVIQLTDRFRDVAGESVEPSRWSRWLRRF